MLELKKDTVSYDVAISSDSEYALIDSLADDDPHEDPLHRLCDDELSGKMTEWLGLLDKRERDVLIYRYGLDGSEKRTLEGVGELLDLTREGVRQIQLGALRKIRNILKKQNVNFHEFHT